MKFARSVGATLNGSQLKQLSKAKKLIREGKRRFVKRPDRDYVEDLLEFGLTEEIAWNKILELNAYFYFPDPKPSYAIDGEAALTFKKSINDVIAYIKIKVEKSNDGEETVCLSFHKDLRT